MPPPVDEAPYLIVPLFTALGLSPATELTIMALLLAVSQWSYRHRLDRYFRTGDLV